MAMMQGDHQVVVRKAKKEDEKTLLELVSSLADYEKLDPLDDDAKERLVEDGFGTDPRYVAYLAFEDEKAVGYALFFMTYSTFLARPTLYLEDIFVLEDHRKSGVGKKLFMECIKEAKNLGCERMEWTVLDWNIKAQGFYEKLGAKPLGDWIFYRLSLDGKAN